MMNTEHTEHSVNRPLVLASTSPYRKTLLARLGLPFETFAPGVDESRRSGESPERLVRRLAEAKARAAADVFADALIIGSDQVAVLDGEIIGKPGDHENAVRQLTRACGRGVDFFTGVCLLNGRRGTAQCDVVPFRVVFRRLSAEQIESYLRRERPYNCAGSFKSEGLGIALFERMEGDDPTALMGLPLIRLRRMLEQEDVAVL